MIQFRKLQRDDLELLHRWLNKDFVKEWYSQPDSTLEGVMKKYLPHIEGDLRTRHFIIMINNCACGLIQWYHLSDWPEYKRDIGADDNSIAIDLFLGEEDFIHRGYGPGIIEQFLREVAFPDSSAVSCYIGPEERNRAAIRCYEKAGFSKVDVLDVPGDPGLTMVMKIAK